MMLASRSMTRLALALLLAAPVAFANSGAQAAQSAFLRGLTALHDFQYEDAVEAFREAQRIDRDFAMAYWGEAMACNQTLWLNQDPTAAREVLERLGPTPETRTLIRICPSDGSGSGTSSHLRTSGGPYSVRTQAYGTVGPPISERLRPQDCPESGDPSSPDGGDFGRT